MCALHHDLSAVYWYAIYIYLQNEVNRFEDFYYNVVVLVRKKSVSSEHNNNKQLLLHTAVITKATNNGTNAKEGREEGREEGRCVRLDQYEIEGRWLPKPYY